MTWRRKSSTLHIRDAHCAARNGRKAVGPFIFAVVLIDVVALGIIIPVFPKLVEAMAGGDASRGAQIFGWFGTFVSSPVLGALSDRFGRRPVISMIGQALDYTLMALAPNLIWLFVGRVISGIASASFSTAFAYLADVTAPEKGPSRSALSAPPWVGPAVGGILGNHLAPVLGGGGVLPGKRGLRLFPGP